MGDIFDGIEELLSIAIWIIIIGAVLIRNKKTKSQNSNASSSQSSVRQQSMQIGGRQSSSMPHVHKADGVHETYNKKSRRNDSGSMPHEHDRGHYKPMPDVSTLPKGYVLLNGEPVRVADLDNK
jgi:hypothetical protein